MPTCCQSDAEAVLGQHFEAFANAVVESVRFYYQAYGKRAHVHEPWTRYSIIRDEIKERMIALCDAIPGLQVLRTGNATFFGSHSKFLLRVKKLSDQLRANTGKTQASFDFDRQEPEQLDLIPGTKMINLYLGYIPVENDPLNPPVHLVCNDEAGGVAWSILLNPSEPQPAALLEPEVVEARPSRVRVKQRGSKSQTNG